MPWINPKLNWTKDDYYNFQDLNRVENNTGVIRELQAIMDSDIPLVTVINRDMKSIDFYDSWNRVENNINLLGQRYIPVGWIVPKTDWVENTKFDYNDARRMELDLNLLYMHYQGNVDRLRYSGIHSCGEGEL